MSPKALAIESNENFILLFYFLTLIYYNVLMNTIFRLIVSVAIFVLVLYLVGISLNILTLFITGERFVDDAYAKLADANIFLSTLFPVINIVVPIFLAFKFYHSNLLRKHKKDEPIVRPVGSRPEDISADR